MKTKWRKKPIVIEAEQYTGQDGEGCLDGMHFDGDGVPWCMTLEGPLKVSLNDWIITGVQGEQYPCKPDIFEQTYDPA